jgi:import inner membrane translocase subunit TIM50
MKRQEAQEHYRNEMKYLQENREELERLLAQDQAAMAAQVPGTLWEAMDQFRGVAPPPAGAPSPGSAEPAGKGAEGGAAPAEAAKQKA